MNLNATLFFATKNLFLSFFVAFFIFGSISESKAQAVTYFPFNSVLSVSSNPNNAFWVDGRLFTNSYFTSVTLDVSGRFNVANMPRAYYYAGAGLKVNAYNAANGYSPIEGFFVDTGVRVRPFDNFKRVQVIFEISPYVDKEMETGILRTMLGIGYNFNQRK